MKKFKLNSIRVRLITLPLIVILMSITIVGAITSYIARQSLLNQMKQDGFAILEDVAKRIEENTKAMEVINNTLDDRIKMVGNIVIRNKTNLSNEFLRSLAKDLNVDEINWFYNGEIINSNFDDYVGWKAPKDHAAYKFLVSNDKFLSEDIRKDAVSGEYKKYGYVKDKDGYFVQVGINATKVKALTEKFSYQRIVEDIASKENIVYALFIDKNLKVVAHSDKERIGIQLTDEGSKAAAVDGKPYSSEYFYEAQKINVYDVLLPVYVDGKHIGAIDIGFSMAHVYKTISKNIITFVCVGIFVFMLLAFTLYTSSTLVVNIIKKLENDMRTLAQGDFTIKVPENVLKRKDEFGEIAHAVDHMLKSIREMIREVKENVNNVLSQSENLSAVSEEMASSSQEVAKTMQQVAEGSTSQANDLQEIVSLMQSLTNAIENAYKKLSTVKQEAESTTSKANIGKHEMDKLIKSIEDIKGSFEVVINKVSNLTNSVKEISNITNVINAISEQTNLLALNAAIEAARAGEAGRGFAVVADEVRKLAEESKRSTAEIVNLISSIQLDTEEVIKTSKEVETFIEAQTSVVENTLKSFEDILESVENIAPLMDSTYKEMDEVINSKDKVLGKVEAVSAVTQQNSAATEEVAASAEELSASSQEVAATAQSLSSMAMNLSSMVNKFKIEE
ncbi:methyl-accepting chemotaxis protein [Caloramator fervidus]|uniref:Methyl-accepting chemotaxis protein n=1 Tax=Caloramator fervidus TaxID=29344 RepID=A0A1H5X3R6_9CLOT|nr:methyl-accepting chemotaxis protein [Caloramator fervidus]SEG06203.1 methyl-accepting chemotaxis protein [Caloramator fervidus]